MDIKDRIRAGPINFNINFLNSLRDVELLMLRSSLFHSVEEKKGSL